MREKSVINARSREASHWLMDLNAISGGGAINATKNQSDTTRAIYFYKGRLALPLVMINYSPM